MLNKYNLSRCASLCGICGGLLLVLAQVVSADFLCRKEVAYKWKRSKESTEASVFVSAVEVKGADEASTKAALEEPVARDKAKATERCRKEHENESACIAAKFASTQTTLHNLAFSARKLLESAIEADCKAQSGVCGEVVVTDAQCRELIVAGAGGPSGAADAGKDAKGGKDKKKK